MSNIITYEKLDRVALLTFNRPESLNTIIPELADALFEHIERAKRKLSKKNHILRVFFFYAKSGRCVARYQLKKSSATINSKVRNRKQLGLARKKGHKSRKQSIPGDQPQKTPSYSNALNFRQVCATAQNFLSTFSAGSLGRAGDRKEGKRKFSLFFGSFGRRPSLHRNARISRLCSNPNPGSATPRRSPQLAKIMARMAGKY